MEEDIDRAIILLDGCTKGREKYSLSFCMSWQCLEVK